MTDASDPHRHWDGQQWLRWDGAAWIPEGQATPPVQQTSAPEAAEPGLKGPPLADGEKLLWEGRSQNLSAAATGGRSAAKYRLTNYYLYFEKGMLSTNAQQVPVAQLHDVDVKQSMTQKARGVGDVVVRIDRGGSMENVTIGSISEPRNVQVLMNQTAHAARAALLKAANTHHYGDMASAPAAPPAAAAAPAPAAAQPDPMEQLQKLAQMRDAGLITPEEYDAKKVELLSRM